MIDKLEFGNVTQLRKTLLLLCVFAIFFLLLINYSTGVLKFLGFEIPINDASIITKFFGCLIIYFLVALLIRYNDDEFRKKYEKAFQELKFKDTTFDTFPFEDADTKKYVYDMINSKKRKPIELSVKFLDIVFPILLAVITLLMIFIPAVSNFLI